MLLENKVTVIYGAGGSVGSATARAFAREGATVFLAGRTLDKLNAVASEINAAGGSAEAAQVDATDSTSVEDFLADVVSKAGRLDISYNLIGIDAPQGAPVTEMAQADFVRGVNNAMASHFLTATAGARHMAKTGSGVILALTAQVGRKPDPNSGSFSVACAAIEGFLRQLAVDVGASGIRVVCLRSSGSPDTPGVMEAMKIHARNAGMTLEAFEAQNAQRTLLKRLPRLAEVANAAALMASDHARVITGAVTNVTCGELID